MYKNRETIEKELLKNWSYGKRKEEDGAYLLTDDNDFDAPISPVDILEKIYQIRQDDLEEVKKIIKEKGLHLGYKNDILEKLDNLNK